MRSGQKGQRVTAQGEEVLGIEAVRVRQAIESDAPGIAEVQIATWRSAYRGIVPDDYLAALNPERQAAMWRSLAFIPEPKAFIYVVETEAGAIVGFAAGGVERTGDPIYRGELYAIYLLTTYQRLGLGHRLVEAVAQHLKQMQLDAMLAWVLKDNPYRSFYQSLGQPLREQTLNIGGRLLAEIAYGWEIREGDWGKSEG